MFTTYDSLNSGNGNNDNGMTISMFDFLKLHLQFVAPDCRPFDTELIWKQGTVQMNISSHQLLINLTHAQYNTLLFVENIIWSEVV